MFSARYVDTEVTRARWRFTANYRVMKRLQVGVEFNATVGEVNPLATLFLLTETDNVPAMFLGTSSDRIGSPEGTTAWFATVSKQLTQTRTSGYFSLNYSEWDDGWNMPFGVSQQIGDRFGARYMYDGQESHALFDAYGDNVGISLMWVWLERFGVALHGGF